MFNGIEQLDVSLFTFLNNLHHPVMDTIMYLFSEKFFWIPLYAILLIPFWKKYGKHIYVPLIGILALITLSDQSSVHLFKEVFERYRPCHNLLLKDSVHIVNNHCGGKFGFVSTHASNTFALAVFITLQLFRKRKLLAFSMIFWAVVVSYSRIYLGVHYPLDVLGGALLGIMLALLINLLVNRIYLKIKN